MSPLSGRAPRAPEVGRILAQPGDEPPLRTRERRRRVGELERPRGDDQACCASPVSLASCLGFIAFVIASVLPETTWETTAIRCSSSTQAATSEGDTIAGTGSGAVDVSGGVAARSVLPQATSNPAVASTAMSPFRLRTVRT